MSGGLCSRRRVKGVSQGPGRLFGMEVEEMSAEARVTVAMAILGTVALSGVVLAFTPVWWIFTTYFWVAFPALGLLGSGIAGLSGARRPAQVSEERELLGTLSRYGEVSAAGVATETSLTVAAAERRLGELARGGHLEVRVRGGAILYALWEYGEAGEERELGGVHAAEQHVRRSGA